MKGVTYVRVLLITWTLLIHHKDAAHCFTPLAGHGCNSGFQDGNCQGLDACG